LIAITARSVGSNRDRVASVARHSVQPDGRVASDADVRSVAGESRLRSGSARVGGHARCHFKRPEPTAHSGTFKAWLGGYGTAHTDRLSQQVTLPPSVTAVSLTFYLHIATEEQTTTRAFDKLRVQVRNANGHIMTLPTFSNLEAAAGYSLKTLDLTPFRGQTIWIQLEAVEDSGSATSCVVDDFAIVIES
jgi:hypothetical protein